MLLALVIIIVGLPYSLESIDGTPKAFTIAYEASELMMDSVVPNPVRISEGGGIRKIRKAIGNISCRSVCGLNIMRISPAVNIGKAER